MIFWKGDFYVQRKEYKSGYYYENAIVTSKKSNLVNNKANSKKKVEENDVKEVKKMYLLIVSFVINKFVFVSFYKVFIV